MLNLNFGKCWSSICLPWLLGTTKCDPNVMLVTTLQFYKLTYYGSKLVKEENLIQVTLNYDMLTNFKYHRIMYFQSNKLWTCHESLLNLDFFNRSPILLAENKYHLPNKNLSISRRLEANFCTQNTLGRHPGYKLITKIITIGCE